MKLHRQYGTELLLHHLLRVVGRPDARPSSTPAEPSQATSRSGTADRGDG